MRSEVVYIGLLRCVAHGFDDGVSYGFRDECGYMHGTFHNLSRNSHRKRRLG